MSTEQTSPFAAAAATVYASMQTYINTANSNAWPYGNAGDTMFDYLMVTNQQGGDFLNAMYTSFTLQRNWYDDWCWPACASMKAFDADYNNVFAGISNSGLPFSTIFQSLALDTWKVVHDGSGPSPIHQFGTQNVWASIDHVQWASVKPRFDGGSWQCDINMDPGDGRFPQQPSSNTLGPFQLSVMNGLLLLFSSRLAELAADPGKWPNAQAAAKQAQAANVNELEFLFNWYGDGKSSDVPNWEKSVLSFTSEVNYNAHAYKSGVLVRERIGTYAQQNGAYPAVEMFDKDRFWAGDQGLQLGGLLNDPNNPLANNVAAGIMVGVKDRMQTTDSAGNPWILSATPGWPEPMCPSCYNAGGGGIFFRNLLYALRKGSKHILSIATAPDYVDYVAALAYTAVNGPAAVGGQNPNFLLMTRLAVLNVAMYYENVLGIQLPKPQPATA